MNWSKLGERKFMVPGSTTMLALVNEAGKLGYSFKLMVVIMAASLVYAMIETVHDVFKMKYIGRNPVPSAPTATGATTSK